MTEIKTYCDHCGKELEQKGYYEREIDIITNDYTVDLCMICADRLNALVKDFISQGKGSDK